MEILIDHKLKYLNRRVAEIQELKASLENGDFDTAVNIGHRLKGNGETFGFPIITTIGMMMETAARERDKEKLKASIDDLEVNVATSLKTLQ